MADLTDAASASTVKIVGADSSGVESNFVNSTTNGISVDGLQSKVYSTPVALTPAQTVILDCTNARTLHIFVDSLATFGDALISVEGSIDGVTYPYTIGSALGDNNNELQYNYPYPQGIYSIPTAGYKKIRITNSHATETVNVATTLSSHQSAVQGIIGRQYSSILNSDLGAAVLFSAPGSDTGQGGIAVRIISSLPATGGGGGDGAINDGANALLKATVTAANALKVDGSAVTQPVSGSVSVSNFPATQAISASSLPLPTGAATDSTLTNGNQKTQLIDGSGNVITSNNIGGRRQLEVSVSNTALAVSGTVAVSNSFALDATLTGGTAKNRLLDGSGSAITSTTISAKQALDVNVINTTSVPVTGPLTDTQLRASAVPVSGTVSANATLSAETTKVIGTVNIAASQSVGLSAGSNLVGKVGIDQTTPGTTNKVSIGTDGTVAATQSGTWTVQPGNTANTTPWLTKIHDGTTAASVIAATNALKVDTSSVAGTATVTASAGVQKVGIAGATAVTMDSADNATAPTNALITSGLYNTTIPALTSGNAAQIRLDSTGAVYVNNEGRKATYSVASIDQTIIASSTAPSFSLTGSATKIVRITKIGISATASTGGVATVILRRFSALSGGTSAAVANIGKHDTNNATATAAPLSWSVAAGTATTSGVLRTLRFELPTPAVTVQPNLYEWTFTDHGGQGLVLRGTSDFIGLCFSAIGTTPLAEIYIEWTEE